MLCCADLVPRKTERSELKLMAVKMVGEGVCGREMKVSFYGTVPAAHWRIHEVMGALKFLCLSVRKLFHTTSVPGRVLLVPSCQLWKRPVVATEKGNRLRSQSLSNFLWLSWLAKGSVGFTFSPPGFRIRGQNSLHQIKTHSFTGS